MAGGGGAQPVSAKPKPTSEARGARRRRAGLRPGAPRLAGTKKDPHRAAACGESRFLYSVLGVHAVRFAPAKNSSVPSAEAAMPVTPAAMAK